MLRDGLKRIADEYLTAKTQDLRGHPLARFIRTEFPGSLQALFSEYKEPSHLSSQGTRFIGNWAQIPWVTILDDRITTKVTQGVYVAYLYSSEMSRLFLCLGIGVTEGTLEEREKTIGLLQDGFSPPDGFLKGPLNSGDLAPRGRGSVYETAVVFYKRYEIQELEEDPILEEDLGKIVSLMQDIASDDQILEGIKGPSTEEHFTLRGMEFEFKPEDVEAAFRKTSEEQWKGRPGSEPYYHVVVGDESKPVKAVFRNMPRVPRDFDFQSQDARRVFRKLGFMILDTSINELSKLFIIGTWRTVSQEVDRVIKSVEEQGGWASWWSFPIKEEAKALLTLPFFLYANAGGGRFPYRFKVAEYITSVGMTGIVSPWPELTDEEDRGKKSRGDRQSEVFKTWLRIVAVEKLEPPKTLEDVKPAEPLSHERNLLNQSTFGYAYPNEDPIGPVINFFEDVFMEEKALREIVSVFRTKKNIILQGPPGVGKTFLAKRLAYALIGEKDGNRVGMIQFHQSYSYEDFLQGYRPAGDGAFQLKNGIFYQLCRKAADDPKRDYVLIIDEINRGNLSKIFGEAMMLIEADKRGPNWSIPLAYATRADDKFFVPGNLYLLGLMNTADRSLAMVDYALRRRFAFFNLQPAFGKDRFKEFLKNKGVSDKLMDLIENRVGNLNRKILEDKDLGAGFLIGHSFFCPDSDVGEYEADWYIRIVKSEILPLLREYWFDKPAQEIERLEEKLLEGL